MVKAIGLSPAARRAKWGQLGLSLLRDTQEMFSNQVDTRVIISIQSNGVADLIDPVPLEALEFMEASRGNTISGVMVRVAENDQYAMMIQSPNEFLGFYLIPSGTKSVGEFISARPKMSPLRRFFFRLVDKIWVWE